MGETVELDQSVPGVLEHVLKLLEQFQVERTAKGFYSYFVGDLLKDAISNPQGFKTALDEIANIIAYYRDNDPAKFVETTPDSIEGA